MRRVAVAVVTVVCAVGVLAAPAFADYATVPDANGFSAHCNITLSTNAATSGVSFDRSMACQYGPTTGTVITAGLAIIYKIGAGSELTQSAGNLDSNGGGQAAAHGTATWSGTGTVTVTGCQVALASPNGTIGKAGCKLENVSYSGGTALIPLDHYPGGTPGALTDVPALPPSACSRRLSVVGNNGTASFRSGVAVVATADDSFAWTFGDTATATDRDVSHIYAVSAQPNNGWTAQVVVTRTAHSGHFFADGTTSATVTCQLRVDFANPDNATPGSKDQTNDDPDCPSGFGWFNPVATLKCLFIPTYDTSSIESQLATTFPFGVVGDLVNGYTVFQNNLNNGLTWDSEDARCPSFFGNGGLDSALNTLDPGNANSETTKARGWKFRLPTPDEAGCNGTDNAATGGDTRSDWERQLGNVFGFRVVVRTAVMLFLWIVFVVKVIGVFGPKRSGLEPDTSDDGEVTRE